MGKLNVSIKKPLGVVLVASDVLRGFRVGFPCAKPSVDRQKEFVLTLIHQHFSRNRRCGYMSTTAKQAVRLTMLVQIFLVLISPGSMTIVCAQQPQNRPVTLHGRVVDARSGEPVAKVKIVVSGAPQNTTTDETGRFTLTDVPAGELNL